MPRPADGKVAKVKSETALHAFICIKLRGTPEKAQSDYLTELGIDMSGAVARQVGATRSWIPPKRAPKDYRPPRRDEALRSWLQIDEPNLGYKRALVHFPGEGAKQVDLLLALKRMDGVRQVIETRERRDIFAIVLFDPDEEDLLLARLEGLGRCHWNGISDEDHSPALRTWESFLKRKARDEDLLEPRRKGTRSSG